MYKHLFGPVPSRRLGMSLGIDLVPHKVCTLDCIYCECGATTNCTTQRKEFVSYDEIIAELKDYFQKNPKPDFVTFSGAGEPTLNSRIGEIIRYIKSNHKDISLALITNASLFYDPEVRAEVMDVDLILPSLDAGISSSFKKINRPAKNLSVDDYIQGLIEYSSNFKGRMWLEVLIIPGFNDDQENLKAIKSAIEKIQPEKVQLNTLDRPGVIDNIRPASIEELNAIIKDWGFDNSEIIAKPKERKDNKSFRTDTENAILETISRRPCTLEDLEKMLGLHINEINKYLDVLEGDGKITSTRQDRGIFYQLNK